MKLHIAAMLSLAVWLSAVAAEIPPATPEGGFRFQTEKFADLAILRYQVPGFEELAPKQKELVYYLYQAALSGRDLIWAQNCKVDLLVRHTLEAIVKSYEGDRKSEEFAKFMLYTKRVWFANGIHHHYSNNKMFPDFSKETFAALVKASKGLPLKAGQDVEAFIAELEPIIFDPQVLPKRVNLADGVDLVQTSATNFYEGVTQAEVEAFYAKKVDKQDPKPVSHGLNSKLVKRNGVISEEVMKVDGLYGASIAKIVGWLEKAVQVAENDKQKKALELLVAYYKTGDLATFDAYNIAWVQDTESRVDVVNGFIETYGDPLSYRGSFESVVSIKDLDATKRIAAISDKAQWFEDHSPILPEHKRESVTGISAKVITVVVESGDSSPSTPIGINLPNANWIRATHGSKSVNLGNIVRAYNEVKSGSGLLQEFSWSKEHIERGEKFGALSDDLHTDMHEVIGHASGQIEAGVGQPADTLKNYNATLEEARADLVALYYLYDPKLIEIGVMDSLDCGKAQYDYYILNGLMIQLRRLPLGENLEEAHMRNRQLVAKWVYEHGRADNVIERKERDGKIYFVINDYTKLRGLFGDLLREIQRVKSKGDYEAGRRLVEDYGVKVDAEVHKNVLERIAKLAVAPYSGFINPKLEPVVVDGKIVDVKISFPEDFTTQMLEYSRDYGFLPARL